MMIQYSYLKQFIMKYLLTFVLIEFTMQFVSVYFVILYPNNEIQNKIKHLKLK